MVKPTKAEREILDAFGSEPMKVLAIATTLGKGRRAVWMCLQIMLRKDLVKKHYHGRYWFAHPEIHGVEE